MYSQDVKGRLLCLVLDKCINPADAAMMVNVSIDTGYKWARAAGWSSKRNAVQWELIKPNEEKVNEYHEHMILALASQNNNAILT